jgi:hypothetical protein
VELAVAAFERVQSEPRKELAAKTIEDHAVPIKTRDRDPAHRVEDAPLVGVRIEPRAVRREPIDPELDLLL